MKTIHPLLLISLFILTILPSCKKDKGIELEQRNIILTDLPAWNWDGEVALSGITLSDEDYNLTQGAIGGIEVKLMIGDKLRTLPYTSVFNNGTRVVYYHVWNNKKITLYQQYSSNNVLIAASTPEELQLIFQVIK